MLRRACPFLWPALVLSLTLPVSSVADWTAEQRTHQPLRLTSAALQTMALLDQSVDPDADLLERLLQPMLVPRYVGSPGHEAVRQHIMATMSALGWEVEGEEHFQMETPLGVRLFTNVVATHDPDCPRRLVLACHYDSIHGRDTFVAATDSAVSCAMMLLLAALLTERFLDPTKGRSPASLQLMFLDGEEAFVQWSDRDSIYGARHLAEKLQRAPYTTEGGATVTQLDRLDMFVLLDLLGARDPVISNYMASTEAEFRHLAGVERRLRRKDWLEDRPAVFRVMKSWGWRGPPQIGDDHLPFLERGVKVLHVIPVPFPSVWHDDADDASVIDLPTVINLGRVLRVFVAEYLRLGELVPELAAGEGGHTEL